MPVFKAVSLPRDLPCSSMALVRVWYGLPSHVMLESWTSTSLRPLKWPDCADDNSVKVASPPRAQTSSPSAITGLSMDALKVSPARFTAESILSMVRIETTVPAGTVIGGGGGGRGGAVSDDARG